MHHSYCTLTCGQATCVGHERRFSEIDSRTGQRALHKQQLLPSCAEFLQHCTSKWMLNEQSRPFAELMQQQQQQLSIVYMTFTFFGHSQ